MRKKFRPVEMNCRNIYVLKIQKPEVDEFETGLKLLLPISTPIFLHVKCSDGLTTLSFYGPLLHHKFLYLANDPTGSLIVYRNILINWGSLG